MIEFRCWYCNRKHTMPQKGVGKLMQCACGCALRVPRYSGGKCRVKSLADWAVEAIVYGGGGALISGGLGLLIVSICLPALSYGPTGAEFFYVGWGVIAGLTVLGFLIGLIFGERGISWIGRLIRQVEGND